MEGRRAIEIMRYVDSMAFERAQLVDCSLHGVGLLAPWPMNVEERFVLKVELKRLTLVMYAVRNCREIGVGEYRVGAELCGFLASPEEENVEMILRELLRN